MTNNYGENVDNNTSTSTSSGNGYQSIQPNTVEDDAELQDALQGDNIGNEDDNSLDLDATEWGGMESGAVNHDSTQNSNWLDTIPSQYKQLASAWSDQQGMLKITPKKQRQKFTYSTVAYIADDQREPKTQIFPISDVNVTPHQITFDFYDTTEGRVGVSNAVEKHMVVECDVYLTDLIYQWWNHGQDNANDFTRLGWSNALKKQFWAAIEGGNYNQTLAALQDIESTKEFSDFRNTFLQQHLGWVCMFSSHTFGVFQGVLTDVSYSISSGETFAKWHLKFEEAIFLQDAYSTTAQKQAVSDDGSEKDSGDASNTEDIDTSTQ